MIRKRTSTILKHPAATGATEWQEYTRIHYDLFTPASGHIEEWLPCRHKREPTEQWCTQCHGQDGTKVTNTPPTWQGH